MDLDAAAEHLLGPADIVVTWEVDDDIRSLVDRIRVPVVNVAHRHDQASLTRHLKLSDNLVTVWPSCRGTFGADNAERVAVIPNGVDLNRCHPLRSRATMRRLWGCSDAALVVGYLGRLDAHKNCVAIARAVEGLGDGAVGVIVGSWTSRAAEVESAVRELVGDRVHVCPPVEDIGSVLAAIDVFMLPSSSEVCSLSLLEAWAAGVPVVATRVGAVPDLEAEYGPLVVSMDPAAKSADLAVAIRHATSGSAELAAMRRRAADLVRQRFNVLRMARAWDEYLVDCWARSEEEGA
jgi:glycosyltransferase involved in cell wall biosynthesis